MREASALPQSRRARTVAAVAVAMATTVGGHLLATGAVRRRPTQGRGGRPVPRGQLRAVVAVLLAAAVGWFAPLFVISLLAFLAIEVMIEWQARRRAPEPQSDAAPGELLDPSEIRSELRPPR